MAYDRERRATEAFFAERRARADLAAARALLSEPRADWGAFERAFGLNREGGNEPPQPGDEIEP